MVICAKSCLYHHLHDYCHKKLHYIPTNIKRKLNGVEASSSLHMTHYHNTSSVNTMIDPLGWPTLAERRLQNYTLPHCHSNRHLSASRHQVKKTSFTILPTHTNI